MIDPIKLLRRSWHILWNYRTLWLFGLILALTTSGGGGNGGNFSNLFSYRESGQPPLSEFERWLENFFAPLAQIPEEQLISTLIGIGMALLCVFLLVGVLFTIAAYVSRVALIRLVDDYEARGLRLPFREGWRLGWSRSAWRLFLIDLLLGVPIFLLVVLMLLVVGLLIAGASAQTPVVTVPTVLIGIGALVVLVLLLIVVGVVLNVVGEMAHRICVLQERGVLDALGQAFGLIRRQWKNVGLMWLVVFGLGIGLGIVTLILLFLLIPLYLLLAFPALIVAGLPGLLIYGLTSLFLAQPLAVLTTLILVLPLFFLIVFAPLGLLGGWEHVFLSSLWTLTYREILALETANPVNGSAQAD